MSRRHVSRSVRSPEPPAAIPALNRSCNSRNIHNATRKTQKRTAPRCFLCSLVPLFPGDSAISDFLSSTPCHTIEVCKPPAPNRRRRSLHAAFRLDMLQLEHMQRQRRDEQRNRRPLLILAEPEPTTPPLSPAEEPESLGERLALRSGTKPESQPLVGYAERDSKRSRLRSGTAGIAGRTNRPTPVLSPDEIRESKGHLKLNTEAIAAGFSPVASLMTCALMLA